MQKQQLALGLATLLTSLTVVEIAQARVTDVILLTVVNETGQDFTSLYSRPENNPGKQKEHLGSNVLEDGQTIKIKVPLDRICTRNRDIIYDIRAEMSNGRSVEESINLCDSDGEVVLGGGGSSRSRNRDRDDDSDIRDSPNRPRDDQDDRRNDRRDDNRGTTTFPAPQQTNLPAVMSILNPTSQVDPSSYTRILAAISSQGLQSTSCSNSSIVVFKINGAYTACAYPNANITPGNYTMNLPGL